VKVIHEWSFRRRCPVDDALDRYDLRVEANDMVKVEDIVAAVEALPKKAFQEELTQILAAKLGCIVTTIGHHSGIKTTCTA